MSLFTSPSRLRQKYRGAARSAVAMLLAGLTLMIAAAIDVQAQENRDGSYAIHLRRVRAIDGRGSAGRTGWGSAGRALNRYAPADYPGDGSGEEIIEAPDRANPRTISNAVCDQAGQSIPNELNLSDYLWAWGQFLDHDISITEAGDEYGFADIEIEDPLDILGPFPIAFPRSEYSSRTGRPGRPRQQFNAITSFIDASNVYGSDQVRADGLRTFSGGLLKTSEGGLPPFNVDGLPNAGGTDSSLFVVGDVRGNENVVLTSLHTLFIREHNRLAHLLSVLDPQANDETLYQTARKIVGAEIQIITHREFLPALLGDAASPGQLEFSPQVDPTIANEFSTAFYRFGHTTLSSNLVVLESDGSGSVLPLQNAFFNPGFLVNDAENVSRLLAGLPTQACQRVDTAIVDDVRNFLFGPPGAGGLDLAMLNIQRGRDHGLADYNTIRAALGMPKVKSFGDITSDTAMAATLEELYGHVDNVDAWVGALAEDHVPGAAVGPSLATALTEQFGRLLTGDRFGYQVDRDLRQAGVRAAISMRDVKLADIIRANTAIDSLPNDVFHVQPPVVSDVVAVFDPEEGRLHLTGNHGDNSVLVMEFGPFLTVIGQNGTRINGESVWMEATGSRPHMTVDLGSGNDGFTMFFAQLGDVCAAMGDGENSINSWFASTRSMATDMAVENSSGSQDAVEQVVSR